MFCLFLVLIALEQPAAQVEYVDSIDISFEAFSERFDPEYFMAIEDGNLFLINNIRQLLAFDSAGVKAFELIPEREDGLPFLIRNYAYIKKDDKRMLALVLINSKRTERIHFYDLESLEFAGYGYDSRNEKPKRNKKPEDAMFRQILFVESTSEIYVNLWDKSFVGKDNAPLLSQVHLRSRETGGYDFVIPEDQAFHMKRVAYEPFGDNMKRRFVARGANGIEVAHQLQERVWSYEVLKGKQPVEVSPRPLDLDRYYTPYGKQPSDADEFVKWYHSFSHTVGLYDMDFGFLLGYMSPNPAHPDYAYEFGEEKQAGSPRHILHLQPLTQDKRKTEDPIPVPGAYLMGVDRTSETAYVFLPKGKPGEYAIHSIALY